jgi:hypothetical protein
MYIDTGQENVWTRIDSLSSFKKGPKQHQISLEGYVFNRHTSNKKECTVTYRCNKFRSVKCPARIKVDKDVKFIQQWGLPNKCTFREKKGPPPLNIG